MIWIVLTFVGLSVLCAVWPLFRGFVLHPFKVVFYGVTDIIEYFYVRKWNACEEGFIDVYCGLFGQGKTLSATSRMVRDYRRYNGKLMRIDGKLQPVEVHLFSNVELKGVPYTNFTTMQQLVDWQAFAALPENHNKYAIFCIDEASSVLNSRSFKDNMNYFTINSLLTCRHSRMGLILTSQRFSQIDKLCRDVSQKVYQCQKVWRVLVHYVYDAYELENIANPLNVKPKGTAVRFCDNKMYGNYDTLALVEQIKKDAIDGKTRSDEEILAAIAPEHSEYVLPDDRIRKRFRPKKEKK